MNTEKKFYQYLFLIVFAALTGYTFLVRASFYNESGLPRGKTAGVRIIGENLAGDFALFKLLEDGVSPTEAYQNEKINAFLNETLQTENGFTSFASPMKAFLSVPWLAYGYEAFFEAWIFLGFVLFGIALYSLFSLPRSVLLMFALPAAFLAFVSGGWGVYVAAGVVLSLVLADNHPKTAGVIAGLCVIEPLMTVLILAAFAFRRQKVVAVIGTVVAVLIVFLGMGRYGFGAFGAALNTAFVTVDERPCAFSSLFAASRCAGVSVFVSVLLQALLSISVLSGAFRLFHNKSCPVAVQNACLCAAGCLISPFFCVGDFGLLYAGAAFLMKDFSRRGLLKGDGWLLFFLFSSIYLENLVRLQTGLSFQWILSVWLLSATYRRRY